MLGIMAVLSNVILVPFFDNWFADDITSEGKMEMMRKVKGRGSAMNRIWYKSSVLRLFAIFFVILGCAYTDTETQAGLWFIIIPGGLSSACAHTLTAGLCSKEASGKEQGRVMGLVHMVRHIVGILASFFGGALAERIGFWTIGFQLMIGNFLSIVLVNF